METTTDADVVGRRRGRIIELFDDTRKRLVDTGTRNRLIHVSRESSRGNVLNIVNEVSDHVHELLAVQRKSMRFHALGRDKEAPGEGVRLAGPEDMADDPARLTDNLLDTNLGPDALQKRLLKLARDAKTAEEEQGVNILYLALGFLTWFEDKSSAVPRNAPLVLLPVELVRNARTSTYDIKAREDDIVTNLPLQQRLKADFGLSLPEILIPEDWRPSHYFAEVEAMIESKPGWTISPDGLQLGFFSFAKLLMYLDLNPDAWPDNALEGHALTRGLLYEGFQIEPPLIGPDDKLDEVLPPSKLFHVVDADASQTKVIEDVRSGRNLVVQGPPGTGKSQTITNIIAAAVKENKSVLFVAEKMAALSVVHDRLVKTGLRDICLELHSKTANKKAVLAEINHTMHAGRAVPASPDAPTEVTQARDELNAIAETLHAPLGATGESAYSALATQIRYIGGGVAPPTLEQGALAEMSKSEEARLCAAIADYGKAMTATGQAREHPFRGVERLDIQPVELARIEPRIAAAREAVARLTELARETASAMGIAKELSFESLPDQIALMRLLARRPESDAGLAARLVLLATRAKLLEALETGAEWRSRRDALAEHFIDSAWAADPSPMRAPLLGGVDSFFARWGSRYRTASRELAALLREAAPKSAAERVALLDSLIELRALRRRWAEDEDDAAKAIGEVWRGERTPFAELRALVQWCDEAGGCEPRPDWASALAFAGDSTRLADLTEQLTAALDEARAQVVDLFSTLSLDAAQAFGASIDEAPLPRIEQQLGGMASNISRYGEWAKLRRLERVLEGAGLAELAGRMASNDLDAAAAIAELRFARAEALWDRALRANPTLRSLAGTDRHALVERFGRLERERRRDNVTLILGEHLAQLPQGAMGEMKVIRGEIGKRRAHMPLRKLFSSAPQALQRIKPVLLMSPISVAQFLPPGALHFDLLVIDEASQVRPEDALGAIARADQIVVVGDQKQLPPTSFFDRLTADDESEHEDSEDEEEGGDPLGGAARLGALESILSLCEARGLGSRMLEWHYRSRDPSLITVSNREFYGNGLILPPSPVEKDPAFGLSLSRVQGAYDRGGKRDNRIEGDAIVARLKDHARAHPTLSLGIVTFSSPQRNLITELIEAARRLDPVLDDFLREGRNEDVFVKNIENVQGDERDVILVSVGYGPSAPGGRLPSMSFGPINADGGERRLNVLFTRARIRCEIFASFDPADIDPTRVTRDGPRILKRFLDYAKSGRIEDRGPTGEDADTPFEQDVADVVRSFGFEADPQVGSAGFRIDIGVRHPDRPGEYIMAIECDGATYHSALWARERDRLRQDVLEGLLWRFHRIWSTDWFYNRTAEIERLRLALNAARESSEAGLTIEGANAGQPETIAIVPQPLAIEIPAVIERRMPAYARAVFPMHARVEPHLVPMDVLTQLVHRIVEAEGPIHVEEVARRVAASFGKEKAGSRILEATDRALLKAKAQHPTLRRSERFWFTEEQEQRSPVRDRSAESGATLKAASISMLEIKAALGIARDDNAGGSDADLMRTAARLLGFRRVGSDLQTRLAAGLALLD